MSGVKERDFLNWVVEVARRTGWHVWHVPAPMVANRAGGFVGSRAAKGLPDLILMHADPPTLIFAELKGSRGRPTDEQMNFLQMARAVGRQDDIIPSEQPVGAYLWQPGDEEMIEGILKSRVLA